MKKIDNKGFTLVELLLAMAFFSFILLFITTGFIVVNRAYNKGITVKLIQDEARSTMEKLVREVRSANTVTEDASVPGCITINSDSYYWFVPVSGDALSPMRLMVARDTTCSEAEVAPSPVGEDLLHERVGVQYMEISRVSDGGNSAPFYKVHMILSTVDADLLDSTGLTASCLTQSASSGNQYCDLVELVTIVSTR